MNVFFVIIQKIINESNIVIEIDNETNIFELYQNTIFGPKGRDLVECEVSGKAVDSESVPLCKDYYVNRFYYNYIISHYVKFTFSNKIKEDPLKTMGQFIRKKYLFLSDTLTNIFIDKKQMEVFMNIFSRIQKTYFALLRFVNICRHKKTSVYNTCDLLMNPVNRYDSNIIEIYQNKRIYLMTVPDIINIMNASLSHSPYFFSETLPIKNPYNNMIFNKSTLYNFYFFIRKSMFIMSELIDKYFLSNFDLHHFEDNNQYIIRDYYIKNYIDSSPPSTLIPFISKMFAQYKITTIQIDDDFPKNRLIEIMRPYLLLLFQSNYSIDVSKRNSCFHKLFNKLKLFVKYNPQFGRKIVKIKPKPMNILYLRKRYTTVVTFNDDHILFNNKNDNKHFMNTHSHKNISSSHYGHVVEYVRSESDEESDEESQEDGEDEHGEEEVEEREPLQEGGQGEEEGEDDEEDDEEDEEDVVEDGVE